MAERSVFIRFYEELNDFLDAGRRKTEFSASFPEGATVKFLIEELGVPHTEVDLVLANGVSVDFAYRLAHGDRISVYPVFESFDIAGVSKVREMPLRVTRFIIDVHLGGLVRCLRLLGFDSVYSNSYTDETIARTAKAEGRIVLTRDRGLLKRKLVTHGYLVRSVNTGEQVAEVVGRFDLERSMSPYSICLDCNIPLEPIDKEKLAGIVPSDICEKYDTFSRCASCGKAYWRGTHWDEMRRKLSEKRKKPGDR